MNRRGRLHIITSFIRQIETHIHTHKNNRQPPITDITRFVNVLLTEHKLSIRIYWKDGYEIEYNESQIDEDLDYLLNVFEQFVSEYDTLLLPEKSDVRDEFDCTLQDNQ